MGRIPRQRLSSGVFHVINRALDKRWIFRSDVDKQIFIDILIERKKYFDINIYHWVIMSSHFHLALESLSVLDLSSFTGKICESYTKYFHKKYGGAGPLWQGRFKSKTVQKQGYLMRLGRYIERNPVRANMNIGRPWEYQWSSAVNYVNGKNDGLIKLNDHPNWPMFGDSLEEKITVYKNFLLSEREASEDVDLFRKKTHIIGDESFRTNVANVMGHLIARKRGRRKAIN